ncbi:uncharacterized protein DNG_07696 [Cephalotrichum gorgonifer]|uniref:Uncharacterized protein n=1 Tax=Cephalotrichum gorgonifer TaxID=2041049 RepID=A0AAE8SXN2_9PEZI|nr:uncharacterized protein DNG_07696 [Cephalotrichum gorgonifer]
MNSLFTVNNHVSISLLSITVTPSTFLAALIVVLVFISIYLSFYLGAGLSPNLEPNLRPQRPYLSAWVPTSSHTAARFRPYQLRTATTTTTIATTTIKPSCHRAGAMLDPLDRLDASLQDFEPTTPMRFGYPSHHSGFKSEGGETEASAGDALDPDQEQDQDSVSAGGYSPPAWRRLENGDRSSGFWRRTDNILGDFRPRPRPRLGLSRETSPEYDSFGEEDVDVLSRAMRTRLPTGSLSPEKGMSPEVDPDRTATTLKIADVMASKTPVPDNYIRFAIRAEVQHRTEPIDSAITFARSKVDSITRSWTSIATSVLIALVSVVAFRSLFHPAGQVPVPDLVKVAGLARSFEPLIYYSENGVAQVGDLQATSVAVWDLGESVRSSNMTSSAIIVKELDELSDSLKTLAIELTKFFANVDGDIDGILIVMDWARREISHVSQLPSQPLSSALDNVHQTLSQAGVLENRHGSPTPLGHIVTSIFGHTNTQRTRQTLQRIFTEFLGVLEESINSELQNSLALFALFEAIDQQFLNLARTVARESSAQDDLHADLLSSLWTRILGADAAEVRKYERNRDLLRDVRAKTVRNKGILLDHNNKLLSLKANLESLRRKLVSPLVRSADSSTLTLEEQIRGLEDVGGYLEDVRKRQKGKLLEMVFGASASAGGRRLIDERT